MKLRLARAWLALCAALAVAGPVIAWSSIQELGKLNGRTLVFAELTRDGLGKGTAESVVLGMMVLGLALKLVVFTASAGMLAWYGRREAFPTVLAGGVLAYGVDVGTLLPRLPTHGRWVFDLNRILALAALAYAMLTLPHDRPVEPWRRVLFGVWISTAWLLLHPVGIPGWEGLRDHPSLSAAIHLGFVAMGIAAMGARYLEQSAAERQQMEWFVWGLAASIAAFAIRLFVGGLVGEVFAHLVYPALQCCTVVALAVAVLKYRRWSLGRVLPRFFSASLLVMAAVSIALLLGRSGLGGWQHHRGQTLVAVLAWAGLSVALVVHGHAALARVVGYVLFPGVGDREAAVTLGAVALEDGRTEPEVLWAVRGAFAHGWPGSRVEIFRVAGGAPVFSAGPAPGAGVPDPLDEPRLVDGAFGEPATLWFALVAHGERVGVVRVVPSPGAVITPDDLEDITKLVKPLSLAVWRVSQAARYAQRRSAPAAPAPTAGP